MSVEISIKAQSEESIPLVLSNNYPGKHKFNRVDNLDIWRMRRATRTIKSMPGIGRNEWDMLIPPNEEDDDDNDDNDGTVTTDNESSFNDEGLSDISNLQASVHVIKASIGTGVLTLPVALKYSGYAFGMGLIFCLSLCAIYCMRCLLEISMHLRSIHSKYIHNLDYEKMVKLCFRNASTKLKKFVWMKHVLYISLSLAEVGFLASYHLFLSENTKSFVDFFVKDPKYIMGLWFYIIAFLVLLTPLVFIRTLDKLAYICQFANLLSVLSLVMSLVYCFQDPIPISELSPITLNKDTFLAFGLIVFSFESINLINPLESNMKDKPAMLRKCGVLNVSTGFVLLFYMTVAFAGYWKFGDSIQSSIILSIPLKPWYNLMVKPLYILSIFISYGLQAYVLINIVWKKFKSLISESLKKTSNIILRTLVPVVTGLLALLVPHLDLFISLIGAFTGAMITLIIPTICHAVTVISNKEKYYWKLRIFIDVMLLLLGIIGGIVGTYTAISNIIEVV